MKRIAAAAALAIAALVPVGVGAHPAPDGFAELSRDLSPAVVNISTAQTVQFEGGLPEFPPGSPLERFNEFFGGPGGDRISNSLGSGFVIDADGVIVTNNHVIEGADDVTVNFIDGTSLHAEVIGRDPATDLAVLRVDPPSPLPTVKWGDSSDAEVGDWVVAIGNPFGLGGTVTAGIISARNRNINAGAYDDFIQTDAAINRGNSGGPLFDMNGDVIGVNTAILSPTGANVGISFSIPAALAEPVVAQLLEFGETRRGWLGVRVQAVNEDVAEAYGLDTPRGALITSISEDSPAEKAGLERGDLVLSFDGRPVRESRLLSRIVAETKIGKSARVEYIREGERRTAQVTVERLESEVATAGGSSRPAASGEKVLGLTLAPLTTADRRKYNIANDVKGVLIVDVDSDSDAAGKMRAGDVIEEVAWEPVDTISQVKARVSAADDGSGRPIPILVNRRGDLSLKTVKPPQNNG